MDAAPYACNSPKNSVFKLESRRKTGRLPG
jgi:hypothetical protein